MANLNKSERFQQSLKYAFVHGKKILFIYFICLFKLHWNDHSVIFRWYIVMESIEI